jgi:hypothetical protein
MQGDSLPAQASTRHARNVIFFLLSIVTLAFFCKTRRLAPGLFRFIALLLKNALWQNLHVDLLETQIFRITVTLHPNPDKPEINRIYRMNRIRISPFILYILYIP